MDDDADKIEKTILKYGSYAREVGEEITRGISQGIKEGVSDGIKRGVNEALKECLTEGLVNIGKDDIKDILEDVPEKFVKNTVKEGVRFIFEEGTEEYVQGLCRKLVDGIREKDIRLNKNQTGRITDIIKRTEQNIMNEIAQRLPKNTFFSEAMTGIQAAMEESLENHFRECERKIQGELNNL